MTRLCLIVLSVLLSWGAPAYADITGKPQVIDGDMMDDRDIWRSAKLLVDKYGEDAAEPHTLSRVHLAQREVDRLDTSNFVIGRVARRLEIWHIHAP